MIVLFAKVGIDNLRIAADFIGRSFGNDAALVHHRDSRSQPHHHAHIVFDDK
jgi:hypothetical protein